MESPSEFSDRDIEFTKDLLAYRRQALELFDAYGGDHGKIELTVRNLEGSYEQEIQQLTGLLDSWGVEPPAAAESLAASELQGAISEEDISDLKSLARNDQSDEFLELFTSNQQGVVHLATSIGDAADSSQVRQLASDASTQSTALLDNMKSF